METEKRLHRCCFTGHRPEKLSLSEAEVKPLLEKAIDTAIENGFTTFITGMAPGVDIWAAEIVLKKRKHNTALHLICAVPHPGFEKRKTKYEAERYKKIIDSEAGINIPANKRKVGFLFQNYALWPNMTVYQNISFGLSNIKEEMNSW